ncbi:hypothetical protein [Lacipirellula limnantheis]|nr:hypothetical protein [Lacipirellula limnantheis]
MQAGSVLGGKTNDFGHKEFQDILIHHDYHATLAYLFGIEEKKVSVPRAAGIGAIARVSSCDRKMLHRAGGSTNRRHAIHRSRPSQ